MSHWLLWLIFVAIEAILIFSCVWSNAPRIEGELSSRAFAALALNDIELGRGFVMDGRDAWLFGAVAGPNEKAKAERAVAEVRGVRVVHNLLTTGEEPVAAETPSEPPASDHIVPAAESPAPPQTAATAPEPKAAAPQPPPAAPPTTSSSADIQRSIDALIADRVVEFEPSRDRLTRQGGALVDEVAALLARNPTARIAIAGHTDSQGTSRNNLTLSQRRAEAVRKRLVDAGIQRNRLTATGYGEDRPIADNSTSKGRLRNRRVEFTVQ